MTMPSNAVKIRSRINITRATNIEITITITVELTSSLFVGQVTLLISR
jgi:hypothetical protein